MKRIAFMAAILTLVASLFLPVETNAQGSAFAEFKLEALYRAAKISWKMAGNPKSEMTVQIMRADTFEEGPYQDVSTVKVSPGKSSYEFIDKIMGAESKYYYKLIIKETNESIGPKPTRPFFSPPAT